MRLVTNQTRTEYYEWENTQVPTVSVDSFSASTPEPFLSKEITQGKMDYDLSTDNIAPF